MLEDRSAEQYPRVSPDWHENRLKIKLPDRELEASCLVAQGVTVTETAEKLSLSAKTVRASNKMTYY